MRFEIAARTAPKTKGWDDIEIVDGLIGVNGSKPLKIDCGLCNCDSCSDFAGKKGRDSIRRQLHHKLS